MISGMVLSTGPSTLLVCLLLSWSLAYLCWYCFLILRKMAPSITSWSGQLNCDIFRHDAKCISPPPLSHRGQESSVLSQGLEGPYLIALTARSNYTFDIIESHCTSTRFAKFRQMSLLLSLNFMRFLWYASNALPISYA